MNIITAAFKPGCRTVRAKDTLYQWDYGQILKLEGLELPEAYEVHFSNEPTDGGAKGQIGTQDGVEIPDEYLKSGSPIYAFVFLHENEDDGKTEYVITIPVTKRPRPQTIKPTPVQQSEITEAIAALNTGVRTASAAAEAAQESAAAAAESAVAADESRQAAQESAEEAAGYLDTVTEIAEDAEAARQAAHGYAQAAASSELNASSSANSAAAAANSAAGSARSAADSESVARQISDGLNGRIEASLRAAKESGEFDGAKGDTGAVFTPHVSQYGVISWTNNGGLPNPETINLVTAVVNSLPYASGGRF